MKWIELIGAAVIVWQACFIVLLVRQSGSIGIAPPAVSHADGTDPLAGLSGIPLTGSAIVAWDLTPDSELVGLSNDCGVPIVGLVTTDLGRNLPNAPAELVVSSRVLERLRERVDGDALMYRDGQPMFAIRSQRLTADELRHAVTVAEVTQTAGIARTDYERTRHA